METNTLSEKRERAERFAAEMEAAEREALQLARSMELETRWRRAGRLLSWPLPSRAGAR